MSTSAERALHAVSDEPVRQLADLRAEQAVLGALMISSRITDEIMEIIASGDFYDHRHATTYTTITGLLAQGQPVDPVTVAHALAGSGDLGRIGGADYLHTLLASVPTAANAGYYAKIIADFSIRRRLRETAVQLHQYSSDLGHDIGDVVDHAQRTVHEATGPRARATAPTYGELLDGTLADVFDPDRPRGLSTGIGALDDVLGGLKPGQLIIIAARPGVGKSVLAVGLARAAAMRLGVPTLMFSLEMSEREVMCRILSAEAGIDLTAILNGRLTEPQRALLRSKADAIRGAPLRIDASTESDLAAMRAVTRRTHRRNGCGLLIVDYLQLMTAGRQDNRVQEVSEISRGLKLLGGQIAAPVVACAQLNRGPEQRVGRRPQLSDLRESGGIEADADVVILLHRDDYYDKESPRGGEIDLIIAKHRNGPMETVTLAAQLSKSRIVDRGVWDR